MYLQNFNSRANASRRVVLILLLTLLWLPGYPQDTLRQSSLVFNGYVKDVETAIFQQLSRDIITANFLYSRLNFKWLPSSSVTASVEMRNRLIWGSMLKSYPGYGRAVAFDAGFADLSFNAVDKRSVLLNVSVDRAWLQYSADKLQLIAGRQRINWGQTFVWNPNDIFNTYSYFDFDYEEKPGCDALRLQYYPSATSLFEVAAKVSWQRKATVAGLYRFNRWTYDFQLIGGLVDEADIAVGAGWSGQLLRGGFRGEATCFFPTRSTSSGSAGVLVTSVGYDYTLKNSLLLQLEVLYNGNRDSATAFSPNQLAGSALSAKNLFVPDLSVFGSASYPVTPLVSCSLSGIVNPKGNLLFIIPSVSISLMENLELGLNGQLLWHYGSGLAYQDMNVLFARLKWSF